MMQVYMKDEKGKIRIKKSEYDKTVWVFDYTENRWFQFNTLTFINTVRLFRNTGYEVI